MSVMKRIKAIMDDRVDKEIAETTGSEIRCENSLRLAHYLAAVILRLAQLFGQNRTRLQSVHVSDVPEYCRGYSVMHWRSVKLM
jgi:hypothetical protein